MKSYVQFASPGNRGRCNGVNTVVVLDCSPSMFDNDWPPSRIAAAKEATAYLIDEKVRRFPGDYVGIVAYGGHATERHSLGNVREDQKQLKAALTKIPKIGSTNLQSGLRAAGRMLSGKVGTASSGMLKMLESALLGSSSREDPTVSNRLSHIIVLSDGDSNAGNEIPEAARLKTAGVIIDCIGIADRKEVDEDKLKAVASLDPNGNPRYRFIGDKVALIQEFGRMAGHLRVMNNG